MGQDGTAALGDLEKSLTKQGNIAQAEAARAASNRVSQGLGKLKMLAETESVEVSKAEIFRCCWEHRERNVSASATEIPDELKAESTTENPDSSASKSSGK